MSRLRSEPVVLLGLLVEVLTVVQQSRVDALGPEDLIVAAGIAGATFLVRANVWASPNHEHRVAVVRNLHDSGQVDVLTVLKIVALLLAIVALGLYLTRQM